VGLGIPLGFAFGNSPNPVSNGTGAFSISIPNSSGLLGEKAYLQSAAGLKTTNGVEILVGNR
jgi:hypothetical protein